MIGLRPCAAAAGVALMLIALTALPGCATPFKVSTLMGTFETEGRPPLPSAIEQAHTRNGIQRVDNTRLEEGIQDFISCKIKRRFEDESTAICCYEYGKPMKLCVTELEGVGKRAESTGASVDGPAPFGIEKRFTMPMAGSGALSVAETPVENPAETPVETSPNDPLPLPDPELSGAAKLALESIKREEGFRDTQYEGIGGEPHIGYGETDLTKLDGACRYPDSSRLKVSEEEAECMAATRLPTDESDAANAFGSAWTGMTTARRAVMIELVYWRGRGGLLALRDMRRAVRDGRWQDAASELVVAGLPSPLRAARLAARIL